MDINDYPHVVSSSQVGEPKSVEYCVLNSSSIWTCENFINMTQPAMGSSIQLAIKKGVLATSTSYSDDVHIVLYNISDTSLYYGLLTEYAKLSNTIPSVTTPILNTTIYTNTDVYANTTYSDPEADAGTVYFEWYINGVYNQTTTNTSVADGTIVYASISSDNYVHFDNISVNVTANDATVNSTLIASAVLQVSNYAPTKPTISSPTAYQNLLNNNVTFNYNSTDTDGDLITYYVLINDILNITDTDYDGTENIIFNTDGTYNVTIVANDGTINSTISDVIYFTIDNTAPIVNITYPTNNSIYTNMLTLEYNFSVIETNIDKYYYTLCYMGGEGITIGCTQNKTILTSNLINITHPSYALYNLTIYANDTSGNVDNQTIFFELKYVSTEIHGDPRVGGGGGGMTIVDQPPDLTDTTPVVINFVGDNFIENILSEYKEQMLEMKTEFIGFDFGRFLYAPGYIWIMIVSLILVVKVINSRGRKNKE